MIVLSRTEGSADPRLDNDELVMLNNAVNEEGGFERCRLAPRMLRKGAFRAPTKQM